MRPCNDGMGEHDWSRVTLPCTRTFCGDHDGFACSYCSEVVDAVEEQDEYAEIERTFDG